MELPIALDTALKALLSCHSVQSWKITAEGPHPTIIMRLRPESQPTSCQSGVRVDSVSGSFRRKTTSQIYRDKRRLEEYRQRRDCIENVTEAESRVAGSQSENTIGHELNTEIIEETPSENQNNRGDSTVGLESSCATDTKEPRAARGGEADKETLTCDEDGSHGTGSDMETDNNTDTDNTVSENEDEQSQQSTKETARDLVKNAKNVRFMPGNLKREERNSTFEKVVLDWRCRETPKLLCISSDVIATCNIKTGETNFELRDLESGILSFWHFWPALDQDHVAHKETIDKIRIEMKKVLSRVRKMI